MKKENKTRLFEMFNKVNKTSIKEWNDVAQTEVQPNIENSQNGESELDERMYGLGAIAPGTRVKIASNAGEYANKSGIVISSNGYNPSIDWNKNALVKLDGGMSIPIFKDRLIPI